MVSFLLGFVLAGLVDSSPTIFKENVEIVGGHDIDIKEAPYQVAVFLRSRFYCGGAIIANDIVISAAHCVFQNKPEDYKIRAGSSSNTKGGVIVDVKDMIWNPDHTIQGDYDIAILWLAKPLIFSDTIQPVKMANAGEEVADGEMTFVTGWGDTEENGENALTLQGVEVPKVSQKDCAAAYDSMTSITPRMLCAGFPEGGKDACQGDSGGPLVHKGKLVGIVSWGRGCAEPKFPGVYAKVSAMRKWVDDNISNHHDKEIN